MTEPNFTHATKQGFDFETEIRPILRGTKVAPNFTPITIASLVDLIVVSQLFYAKGNLKRLGYPGASWATYFLSQTQKGGFDGTGFVLFRNSSGSNSAARFAICEHSKQTTPDARPHVGWHPGFCTKCGLDLSVDSGD